MFRGYNAHCKEMNGVRGGRITVFGCESMHSDSGENRVRGVSACIVIVTQDKDMTRQKVL